MNGEHFHALRVDKSEDPEKGPAASLVELTEEDLMEGTVTVEVSHSSLNYKDALALTGAGPVIRRFPLIPGIDFAGVVHASADEEFQPGHTVVLNGWGCGETHHGGYSRRARVPGPWLVTLPEGISREQAMAVGTAGYTAMLCVMALEDHGVEPEDGPLLVTGACGGVGSIAVLLLSKLGYQVTAATGRTSEEEFLRRLGAAEVIDRAELHGEVRPLGHARWAGAVDVAGSTTLANVLSQTRPRGTVAACGLAQGMDLPTSVAPFILRGVTLAGIDSAMCPRDRRDMAWHRLAVDLDFAQLEAMTTHVPLRDVPRMAEELLAGKVRGRVVVDVADSE